MRFVLSKLRNLNLPGMLLLTLLGGSAWAQEVRLFDESGKADDFYNFKVQKLKPGNVLIYQKDGQEFRFVVEEKLGGESNNLIFKVKRQAPHPSAQSIALRVPLTETTAKSIGSYLKGAVTLEQAGVPIPKIFDSVEGQFLSQEIVDKRFDLHHFLMNPKEIEVAEYLRAKDGLLHFARSMADFKDIGDFHSRQLVFEASSQSWILLDFSESHEWVDADPDSLLGPNLWDEQEVQAVEFENGLQSQEVPDESKKFLQKLSKETHRIRRHMVKMNLPARCVLRALHGADGL